MKMADGARIAERVRGRREALGMSRPELATKAKVDASYLSRLESGKGGGSIPELFRVASVLGMRMDDILNATPDQDLHVHAQSRLATGDRITVVIDRIIDKRADRPQMRTTIDHMLEAIASLEEPSGET